MCTLEGIIDVIANTDTDADLSAISRWHLRSLKMAGWFIEPEKLSPPPRIGLAAVEVDYPVHVGAENCVKLSVTLQICIVVFWIQNGSFLVLENHLSEVLISLSVLQDLNFDFHTHISEVWGTFQEANFGRIGEPTSEQNWSIHRVICQVYW